MPGAVPAQKHHGIVWIMNMTMAIVTMILPIIVTMTAIKATVTMIMTMMVMATVPFCMIMIESSLSLYLCHPLKTSSSRRASDDSRFFCSNYYTLLLH